MLKLHKNKTTIVDECVHSAANFCFSAQACFTSYFIIHTACAVGLTHFYLANVCIHMLLSGSL